ncbi:MAG: hypothetical protein A2Y17_03270 [Clostridiales bacterium GWF2_38_85]|nr:MAG: hypothetical protein A2Y17_03270 [Clostridiales bacterium GWF2_38_85]HBL85228.1 hypothetical protein [Clostridiales bacterium]
MRKIILLLFVVGIVFSSCQAKQSSDDNINTEVLTELVTDSAVFVPSEKIEVSDAYTVNSNINDFDPASVPMNKLIITNPTVFNPFTLPEVLAKPVVTRTSNGISELVSNLYVSDNKVVLHQSSGSKLKTDTTKLDSLIANYAYDTSFLAIRISDGSYIAYNIDDTYICASTVKAPYALYIYQQIANGAASLNDSIKYQSYHYTSGSGVLKYSDIGSTYSIKTLLNYSMVKSDNIAYMMLYDKFGNGASSMLASAGCKNSYSDYDWPLVSARDAAIWWNEIYEFKDSCSEGKDLFNLCLSVSSPITYDAIGMNVQFAHKSGWVHNVCHEAGIIMTNDPYILIVLTTKSYTNDTYTSHIVNVVREIDKIMRNY